MTFLVERLAELRRHLDHLRELRPRIGGPEVLERDLSLHNDVLFSLLTVCQTVIDIAGELSARRGDPFEDYTRAVRNLAKDERFPAELVRSLERLPGFRNVLVHEYVDLDLARVVEALDELDPIERFAAIVADIEAETSG
ncbi:MAG TPA: HepT-like ribonuclease domain-containing protein [Actinomycetota bacterium]|nr:HepT-like ribonuclease domain-containing protein [Actinomycetota bacterium]